MHFSVGPEAQGGGGWLADIKLEEEEKNNPI